MTIGGQIASAVRMDAYNATIFLAREFHWLMPAILRFAFGAAAVVVGVWLAARKPGASLARSATGLFTAYGGAFLFGKWAFCNYHCLLASFLLLYLVGASAVGEPKSA